MAETDGITWTAKTLPSPANWNTTAYGGGMFIFAAYNQTTGVQSAASSP